MTYNKRQKLRVDVADWEGNSAYAEYNNFRVDSVQQKYRLASLGTCTGNAGITVQHGRAQHCCKGDGESEWETPDFGPPSSLTPGAIDLQFGTVDYVRGTTPHAKNCENRPSRVAPAQR